LNLNLLNFKNLASFFAYNKKKSVILQTKKHFNVMFAQLSAVKALDNYSIFVAYKDGVQGIVDLQHLAKKGVFCQWDKNNLFQNVHISDYGAIAWNEDIDICSDSVYLKLRGLTYDNWKQQKEKCNFVGKKIF
jgi:hypothetical protein